MPLPALATILRNTGFSPAQLNPSFWIEARRTEGIFTSNAGTGAISDGATVGFWSDLSVNGLHVNSTADDTTRPTFALNSGKSFITFDGSNDYLKRSAGTGMYAAGSGSVFVAAKAPSAPNVGRAIFSEGKGGNAITNYSLVRLAQAAASSADSRVVEDAGTVLVSNTPTTTSVWSTTASVFGVVDDGAVINPYLNGVAQTTASYTRSGTLVANRIGVGATATNGGPAFNCLIDIYAIVCVNRVLTPNEIGKLTTYLANLT